MKNKTKLQMIVLWCFSAFPARNLLMASKLFKNSHPSPIEAYHSLAENKKLCILNLLQDPKHWRGSSPITVCWIGVKVAVLCAHGNKCHEIYFWSKFWIIFDIFNTWSWLWLIRKHIWNIIEEIVLERSKKVQFLITISSIMLQICFWASPSRNLVFEISKIMQNFD